MHAADNPKPSHPICSDLAMLLERDGVTICKNVVSGNALNQLCPCFNSIQTVRAGARSFDLGRDVPDMIHSPLRALAVECLGGVARLVRILFFDKTAESNWAVPWHQDRAIAVRERIDTEGYGPWSIKDGIVHVEPPVAVLESMVTLRLFVDDCDADNGPLEIALGSHRHGRIPSPDLSNAVQGAAIFVGAGKAGDVLVMKALAIHRSARARIVSHRRVLHVDFAACELASPLEWVLD